MRVRQVLDYILAKSEAERRSYLTPGERAPEGSPVLTGKRGGKYFIPEETTPASDLRDSIVDRTSLRKLGINGGVNENASSIIHVAEGSFPPRTGLSDFRALAKYDRQDPSEGDPVRAEKLRYAVDQLLGHSTIPDVIPLGEGFAMRWVDDSGFGGTGVRQLWRSNPNNLPLTDGQLASFANITIMDCLMGNFDRHQGNYVVDDDNDKVWAIDNEAGDPLQDPPAIYPLRFLTENLPGLLDSYDLDTFRGMLAQALSDVQDKLPDIADEVNDIMGVGSGFDTLDFLDSRMAKVWNLVSDRGWADLVAYWKL